MIVYKNKTKTNYVILDENGKKIKCYVKFDNKLEKKTISDFIKKGENVYAHICHKGTKVKLDTVLDKVGQVKDTPIYVYNPQI